MNHVIKYGNAMFAGMQTESEFRLIDCRGSFIAEESAPKEEEALKKIYSRTLVQTFNKRFPIH